MATLSSSEIRPDDIYPISASVPMPLSLVREVQLFLLNIAMDGTAEDDPEALADRITEELKRHGY